MRPIIAELSGMISARKKTVKREQHACHFSQTLDLADVEHPNQYLRHFFRTLDLACAERTPDQGFEKNGEHFEKYKP